MYYRIMDADERWLAYLRAPGQWLADRPFKQVADLATLLTLLTDVYRGAVLYDPAVPATSMLASTIAGADNLLPICNRTAAPGANATLFQSLVLSGIRLPVVVDLTGRFTGRLTGSRKNDAYVWAREAYLQSGRSNPTKFAYYLDYYWTMVAPPASQLSYTLNTVPNHDYFIAHRGIATGLRLRLPAGRR